MEYFLNMKKQIITSFLLISFTLSGCIPTNSSSESSSTSSDTNSDSGENSENSTYTITWLNYDNTVLEIDENVQKGVVPIYDGETPARYSGGEYSYTFIGWSPNVVPTTSNATYTAQFDSSINTYTITWKNDDGNVLEIDYNVEYGTTPSYDGDTPTKAETEATTYTFGDWSPELTIVYEDTTYIAQFYSNAKDSRDILHYSEFADYVVINGVNTNNTSITEVVIPITINGKPIIKIDENAFDYCPNLVSIQVDSSNQFYSSADGVLFSKDKETLIVYPKGKSGAYVIPDSVTTFGKAFQWSRNLTIVTIPDNVTEISDYAFNYCPGLTRIIIGAGVKSIGEQAFSLNFVHLPIAVLTSIEVNPNNQYYSSIDGVLFSKDKEVLITCPNGKSGTYVIPDGVTTIPSSAFYECANLDSIIISKDVKEIVNYVFYDCTSLSNIEVDSSNQVYSSIGGVLFSKDKETLITYPRGKSGAYIIPNNVRTIHSYAFFGCDNLSNVVVGTGVTLIEEFAFNECNVISGITIPDNVTTIESRAFYGCKSLIDVIMGNGIISISSYAFSACNNLQFSEYDNLLYLGNEFNTYLILMHRKISNTEYTINPMAKIIADGVFRDCKTLISIEIPNSVTIIGSFAFYGCENLPYIIIPDSVTTIGRCAFAFCKSITSIVIPDTVISIGSDLIWACTNITSIIIPAKFSDLFESIIGNIGEPLYDVMPETLTITGTDAIADGAFSGFKSLNNVIIGDNVTSIGKYAFGGCTNLTSVIIGEGVTKIDDYAFNGCSSLSTVVIPDSVTSIGRNAFSDCEKLTTVKIGAGVNYIGSDVFSRYFYNSYCSSLISIEVDPNNQYYSSVDGVLFTKDKKTLCIYPKGKSGAYVIPDGVITIGVSAFKESVNLTSITIPNGVTEIERMAFQYCLNLTSVTIGASVSSIGEVEFSGCENLDEIYVNPNNQYYSSIDGVLFNKNVTSLIACPAKKSGNYIIPSSVVAIRQHAFYGCASLSTVVIPISIYSIGLNTFFQCYNLIIYCEIETIPTGYWPGPWAGFNPESRPTYFGGTWHYDSNGNPVPNT